MEIRFKFDGTAQDNLTWDDLEILESGRMGATKNILARFVVDAADQPVEYEKAKKLLGSLKLKDVQAVVTGFLETMNNSAINPQTAA